MERFYILKRTDVFRKGYMILALIAAVIAIILLYRRDPVIQVFRYWKPLSGRIIVIDAGHGGIDGGTYHSDGTLEKNINLQVALKLKGLLEKGGANVVMTRTKDVALDGLNSKSEYRHKRDLIARTDIINRVHPDIFISIHVNAERGSASTRGPMVFYYRESENSRKLAGLLQKRLEEAYRSSGQAVRVRRPLPNSSLFLLCNTHVPGVIAELGFMTNSKDRSMLVTDGFQQKLGQYMVYALEDYF